MLDITASDPKTLKSEMIKSRQEILIINQIFAYHLLSVQRAKHESLGEWKEGESVILDESVEAVTLTKEQADELNNEDKQYYLDNRDDFRTEGSHEWIGGVTLISSEKDAPEYLADLAQSLKHLSKDFGQLIILGDWSTPWLNQQNDYPPVSRALKFLGQKIDDEFNGGFVLSENEILEFIPHLFWLTRCNASLPEFMMTFENAKTVIEICKYGVLHLAFYNIEEREQILKIYRTKGFKKVENCSDPIYFDDFKGRRIKING